MEKTTEQNTNLIRIAITGPESTGKSELAYKLANHYNTLWVPEYSREYLGKISRAYKYEDIVKIAQGQINSENNIAKKANKILFSDTELIVTKIWSMFKYGKCDPYIENNIVSKQYDLYILCNIDLPWEFDPLREHPDKREELLNMYIHELKSHNFRFSIISGIGNLRVQNAIYAIESFLKQFNY